MPLLNLFYLKITQKITKRHGGGQSWGKFKRISSCVFQENWEMNGAMKMERKRIHFLGEVFSLPSLSSDLMVPINKIKQSERGQHLCQAFTWEKSFTPTGLVNNTNVVAVSLFWNTNMWTRCRDTALLNFLRQVCSRVVTRGCVPSTVSATRYAPKLHETLIEYL